MSSKINVVDVGVVEVEMPAEQIDKVEPTVEQVEQVVTKKPKTSRTKKEIKPTHEEPVKEETVSVEPVEKVVMKKPKTSRTKKEAKPIQEEPVKEEPVKEEPVKEEPVKEEPVEAEKKNIKTVELVPCPKCGKKLTQRTLNYSHQAVCPANGDRPAKKSNVKTVGGSEYGRYLDEGCKPMDDAKLQRVSRIRARSEKYQYLISNAF
jgi:hypothetical protein